MEYLIIPSSIKIEFPISKFEISSKVIFKFVIGYRVGGLARLSLNKHENQSSSCLSMSGAMFHT